MNRTYTALMVLLLVGLAFTGTATANVVDSQDVAFIAASGSSTPSEGANHEAWASAGVVSQSDLDFLTGDNAVVVASSAAPGGTSVGVIDAADYRLIAGDGSLGATCEIALVAAINPGC
jgi:hypothetical protein